MLTVFIVEDEPLFRKRLKTQIGFESGNYQLAGEASDGELALAAILRSKPDIVITDIEMPFISGLDMAKQIKASLPDTEIIILSGHDTFEYAKEAISIGVREYLLKPVSRTTLLAALDKAAAGIAARSQSDEKLRHLHETTKAFEKNRLLTALIDGVESNVADLIERARQLDIELIGGQYCVAILNTIAPELSLEITLAKAAIHAYWRNEHQLVCLCVLKTEDELQAKHMTLQRLLPDTIIHTGPVVARISEIPLSFQAALAASQTSAEDGDSITRLWDSNQLHNRLMQLIFSLSADDIYDRMALVLQLDRQSMRSLIYRVFVYSEIVAAFRRIASEYDLTNHELLDSVRSIERLALNNDSADKVVAYACQIAVHLIEQLQARKNEPVDLYVDKAIRFLQQHFSESELNLNDVARHVNVSAGYLSAVFKNKTGRNYVDYLSDLRIEKAKRLLETTSLPIADVAEQAGYQNTAYFSAAFKKHVGVTPTEHRQQHEQ